MKYLLIFLAFTLVSCSSKEPICLDFAHLNWCGESATSLQINGNILQVENEKDGLFFVADVEFEALVPSKIIQKQDALRKEYKAYTRKHYIKKGVPFEAYTESSEIEGNISNAEIISGEIYGFADSGLYTIKFRGINQNKVNRIIELLMK